MTTFERMLKFVQDKLSKPVEKKLNEEKINGGDEITFYGYKMTKEQEGELMNQLKEDIIERYHNAEYWDEEIIAEFAQDNKLTKPATEKKLNEAKLDFENLFKIEFRNILLMWLNLELIQEEHTSKLETAIKRLKSLNISNMTDKANTIKAALLDDLEKIVAFNRGIEY